MIAPEKNNNKDNKPQDGEQHEYSPGMEALVKSLKFVFAMLIAIIIIMFIWLFTFGGYFIVQPQEVVLVLRFGKLMDYMYKEDWHWIYPFPINEIIRIPISEQTIRVDFLRAEDVKKLTGEQALKRNTGPLIPGKDNYLLTGDANIIHTRWEMVYQITEPDVYFRRCLCPPKPGDPDEVFTDPKTGESLGTRGPRTLLKNLLQSVILKVTARQIVDNALYGKHNQYETEVQREMEKAVNNLNIGVTVNSVVLTAKEPPLNTKAAFDEVIEAEQESSTEKSKAREYAIELENQTAREKSKILTEAQAYKIRVVADIKSEVAYFRRILKEYRENKNSDIILAALYNDTIAKILSSAKDKYVIRTQKGNYQEVRIHMNPEPKYKKFKKTK